MGRYRPYARGKQKVYTVLRTAYSSALINGPFSILVGSKHGLLALNDRLKLRSLITAERVTKHILRQRNRLYA